MTASGASAQLSDAWKSKVLPLCQAAFDRYPFIVGSTQDVPLDDFVHLLGPGGLMDQFFDQYLKSFIDTSKIPWKWQSADHVKLGLAEGTVLEFQRASEIRDALFPTGGTQVSVKFQLTPVTLDAGLAQVSLEAGGTRLTYAHGPLEPTAMVWPGQHRQHAGALHRHPRRRRIRDGDRRERAVGAAAPARRGACDAKRPAGQVPRNVQRAGGQRCV